MSAHSHRISAVIAATLVASLGLAACGDSGASQEELDRARQQGAAKAHQKERLKKLEKELRSLKKNGGSGQSGVPAGSGAPSSGDSSSCGKGVSVGADTTCGFAANVQGDYYAEIGSGPGSVYSYSPATGEYYTMYCSAGAPHVCTGGNNASVYFP